MVFKINDGWEAIGRGKRRKKHICSTNSYFIRQICRGIRIICVGLRSKIKGKIKNKIYM
jgi:hypothetical protein